MQERVATVKHHWFARRRLYEQYVFHGRLSIPSPILLDVACSPVSGLALLHCEQHVILQVLSCILDYHFSSSEENNHYYSASVYRSG